MTAPITRTAEGIDFSPRFVQSTSIVASPSGTAETVVASTPVFPAGYDATVVVAVLIIAQVAYTVAGSGTAVTYRIRTGVTAGAGTVVVTTGATTAGIAAAGLVVENIIGLHTSPASLSGQQYSLTVAVTGGSGASTVSAVAITALAL